MIEWDDDQLKEAGINKRKLETLVKRFERCTKQMDEMGLTVYGASGHGYLVHVSRPCFIGNGIADQDACVADIGIGYDGGDW